MQAVKKSVSDLIIYQIYVKSFLDTNGDGVGDLQGVIDKLDYLQALGINAIWLTPCYPSPNYDNGYDVSNYTDIADVYGGMPTWERLVDNLHSRGMLLIMDLVANHTSIRHPWFEDARKSKDSPYHGYYYFYDTPPNKWRSVFGGSAWEYNAQTGEYYLHSFAKEQADLNWENPSVRQEIKRVVDFWVKKGVDGFRCDVLDYTAKDFAKGLMFGGEKLPSYIQELFDGYGHIFTVGECQSTEKNITEFCGKQTGKLTCIFQFDHLKIGRKDKWKRLPCTAEQVKKRLCFWQEFCQQNSLYYALFTDNHDYGWFVSVCGNEKSLRFESATMYAAMFYLLKGIPFVYQGQEIGLVNSTFKSIRAFQDVETKNYYQANVKKLDNAALFARLNFGSRDNPRRPMAWTDDKSTAYGFSSAKPWLGVSSNGKRINVERDRKQGEKSVQAFYTALFALRKRYKCFTLGAFVDVGKGRGYFMFERTWQTEKFLIVCNFEKPREIALQRQGRQGRLVLKNYADRIGFERRFRPYEVAVFQLD